MINKLRAEVAELKAKLAKAILGEAEFSATKTDKAVLVYDVDELAVGTGVFVEDEEGNRTPADDGIYTQEDGTRINVTEGKVTEILEPEEEAEAEETPVEEELEETPAEDAPADYVTREEFNKALEDIAKLYELIDGLVSKNDATAEEFNTRLAVVERTPAGRTPAEDYKNEDTMVTTGDASLDRKLANIRKFKK